MTGSVENGNARRMISETRGISRHAFSRNSWIEDDCFSFCCKSSFTRPYFKPKPRLFFHHIGNALTSNSLKVMWCRDADKPGSWPEWVNIRSILKIPSKDTSELHAKFIPGGPPQEHTPPELRDGISPSLSQILEICSGVHSAAMTSHPLTDLLRDNLLWVNLL